jgi:hypothetical protein
MRKVLLYGLGGAALLVATVALSGYMLPVEHTAAGSVELAAAPDDVFAVLTDFESYPDWRTDVTRVDVTGERGAGQVIREFGGNGEIPYRIEAFAPPTEFMTRIADPDLPFGGTWTYELRRSGAGTMLTITEDGEVYNPIFRFMSAYVFGHTATIEQFLHDIEARMAR